MPKRRKLQRRHLVFYLRVFERDTDNLLGSLVDITSEGIMIMSESSIETDKVFHLRMHLGKEMGVDRYLDFDALSIWCKNDVNPDFYDTGFRLLNISYEEFGEIEDIIERLGFKD
jgi:hypothetical protein